MTACGTSMSHGSLAAADRVNIASRLRAVAQRLGDKPAVVQRSRDGTGYLQVTFRELDEMADCYAHGLSRAGVGRETRTVLFVQPGVDFFALVFALFRIGAVVVLIDPGLGAARMGSCLAEVEAEAFIGTAKAQVFRLVNRGAFRRVRVVVTAGRRWCWGGATLRDICERPWRPFAEAATSARDLAAILFTSGSTGPAKGVLYEHGVFEAQVKFLETQFGYSEDEVDLPTFPLFALFDAALGMSAVIPEMDFTRPGSVDPRTIVQAIKDQKVTHMFGSPALLERVSRYGAENGVKLPTVRRVMSAGAPARLEVLERMQQMLGAGAEIHTPYGATESLPVASITSTRILNETRAATERGAGVCVGEPLAGVEVRIIRISDGPIVAWSDDLLTAAGEIGEIAVRSAATTRGYVRRPDADAASKIRDGDSLWHRMGDLGYLDERGRLWYCGRKSQRVVTERETLFTDCCEAVFNNHPAVFRSALVGVGPKGRQQPVVCVELERDRGPIDEQALVRELAQIASHHELTRSIETFLVHPAFPVDVRHNSKIFREKLACWAAKRVQ